MIEDLMVSFIEWLVDSPIHLVILFVTAIFILGGKSADRPYAVREKP